MGLRADRKKRAKKFRVGDIISWGLGKVNAEVVEISIEGLYVDTVLEDGRKAPRYFVPFVPQQKYGHVMKAPWLVSRPK